MVKVMDATYEIAKYGPIDMMGYCSSFVGMYALERVLYSELFYFLLSAGASIMIVVHLVFSNSTATLLVGSITINIMIIVYMGIY